MRDHLADSAGDAALLPVLDGSEFFSAEISRYYLQAAPDAE